jgi:hypothetical protein
MVIFISINLIMLRTIKYEKILFEKSKKISVKTLPKNPNFCGVIIEPRIHRWIEPVLKINYDNLSNCGLCFICGNKNYKYVREILNRNFKNFRLIKLNIDNLLIKEYSSLLKNRYLWDMLNYERVFIFQLDGLILKKNVSDFLIYDYIGAPWKKEHVKNHKLKSNIGNGGMSIRNPNKMIEIIDKFDLDDKPEDVYFSENIKQIESKLPNLNVAKSFSSEHILSDSMCHHQIYLFHNFDSYKKIYNL